MIEGVEIMIGDRPSSRCVRQQDDAMDGRDAMVHRQLDEVVGVE